MKEAKEEGLHRTDEWGRGREHSDEIGMNTLREEFETDDIAIVGRCCFPFQQLERGSSAPVSRLYTQNVNEKQKMLTQDTVSKSSAPKQRACV